MVFPSETELVANAQRRIESPVISQRLQFGSAGIGIDVLVVAVIGQDIKVESMLTAQLPFQSHGTAQAVEIGVAVPQEFIVGVAGGACTPGR